MVRSTAALEKRVRFGVQMTDAAEPTWGLLPHLSTVFVDDWTSQTLDP
jgi:hypothetical protein